MTLALYARRKTWPLEGVEIRLTHSRIHAEDCEECETREGRLDRIERVIALAGDLNGGAARATARDRRALSRAPDADVGDPHRDADSLTPGGGAFIA